MALARKINKAAFDKLPDAIKAEYDEDGDGYTLQTTGDEDTGALKRAKDREAQKATELQRQLDEAQEKIGEFERTQDSKTKDIRTLEKSWERKNADLKAEYEGKVSKLQGHIKTGLVDAVAMDVANKISTSPKILAPHIKARLVADFDGETPVTKVLDANGQPSAMSVEDLQKEFAANKDFSAIITASRASGGARPAGANGGGAPANPNQQPAAVNLAALSPKALADHIKAQKAAETE